MTTNWTAFMNRSPEDCLSKMLRFDGVEQRWHVESCYARRSFGVGDVVSEHETMLLGGEGKPNNVYALPFGYEAKTTDDARRMALAFAYAISGADGDLAVLATVA